MDRKGHYVRPGKRCVLPTVAFAVAPIKGYDTCPYAGTLTVARWYAAEVAVSYRRGDQWGEPETALLSDPDALRDWMGARALDKRTNWVIAPHVDEALTLSQWWNYAERKGCAVQARDVPDRRGGESRGAPAPIRVSRISMSALCSYIDYTDDGRSWQWVSAANYWPGGADIPRVADGDVGARVAGAVRGDDPADRAPAGQALALLARFRGLCGWWSRVARCRLGRSAGALAWGVLRSHLPGRALCTHADADAHRLERAAAHGGRASVWYRGLVTDDVRGQHGPDDPAVRPGTPRVRGPLAHVDVTSMYPALMRDELFPVKIDKWGGAMSPRDLIDCARGHGVIARVRIETDRAEYPYPTDRGVRYPLGRFTTTLAGPDIAALADHGTVVKVYDSVTYKLGRPFVGAVDALMGERQRAADAGDRDLSALSKLVSVTLAGRCAQRAGKWVRRPKMDEPGRWGELPILSTRSDKPRRVRWLLGAAWEWEDDDTGAGPHTAVFAYLTAYGRQLMARVRSICPPRSVIAQHTDGLWVLPAALDALAAYDYPCGAGPGTLRIDKRAPDGEFFGPAHYRAGSEWTLGGLAGAVVDETTARVTYQTRTPLFAQRAGRAPDSVIVKNLTVPLPAPEGGGTVGADGWTSPPRMNSKWREEEW